MLWMVRHGQSQANAGEITADEWTNALTPLGQRQADRLADLCSEPPARVVVSPYLRARQTAAPFLARHPGVEVQEWPIHEFTYLATARSADTDRFSRQPLVDEYWSRMDPNHHDGPGAESFREFVERIEGFLATARRWTGLTVAFAHEQVLRVAIGSAVLGGLDGSEEGMRRFHAQRFAYRVPNGSILRMESRGECWWTCGIDDSLVSNA